MKRIITMGIVSLLTLATIGGCCPFWWGPHGGGVGGFHRGGGHYDRGGVYNRGGGYYRGGGPERGGFEHRR